MNGPYETEAQAFAAAEPMRERLRQAYNYPGQMTEETRAARHAVKVRYVADILEAAGVGLGAHDGDIVRWIARVRQPETIAVLLDWIERAHAAALAELPAYGSMEAVLDALDDQDGDGTPDYLHALPPINHPGRVVGVEPGPRCGAQGRTALFAADVTCPACLADMAQDGGQR